MQLSSERSALQVLGTLRERQWVTQLDRLQAEARSLGYEFAETDLSPEIHPILQHHLVQAMLASAPDSNFTEYVFMTTRLRRNGHTLTLILTELRKSGIGIAMSADPDSSFKAVRDTIISETERAEAERIQKRQHLEKLIGPSEYIRVTH